MGSKRYFVVAAPLLRKTATRRLRPLPFKMKNTLQLKKTADRRLIKRI